MVEKMVDVIVDNGFIVDLGSACTLYIPSDADFIACYEDLQLHDHIEQILVDEGNEFFFAENDCLLRENHYSQANGEFRENIDGIWIELVLGCKNSIIPKINYASHYTIGRLAFSGVDIKSIALPENITAIGHCAFSESTLEDIFFNDKLNRIDSMAFLSTNLKSIVIPKNTKQIGVGAFAACKMLESIKVEEGNETYYSENNCLIDKENKALIACAKDSIIPDGVYEIKPLAFYGMDKDGIVTIPASVKKVGKVYLNLPSFIEYPITFKAPKDSYAIKFAKENGIRYIEM